MILIMTALIMGFVVGRLEIIPTKLKHYSGKVGSGALLVLLFSMGATMGANHEVINNLASLGLKALLTAIGTIAGSVLAVWIAVQFTVKRRQKQAAGGQGQ
ncbi:MAG: lysine exporter LysO family protein [Firmicutes bacterium]|nr:lysine exporter LysO family protein [Bacillota bacterium]